MKNFLIACGGTGGHLSPGIALAEGLVSRGHRATLLISHKKVDARLVEKYPHLTFLRIPGAPFSVKPAGLIRFVFRQFQGLWFGLNLVRRERPDGIVGFGGFTTAAIVLAGVLLRVPVALHEANRVPGRAIRLLGPIARRVYLPPGVRLRDMRYSLTRPMGLPVRKEIVREPRASARLRFGLDPLQSVLVVLGGSQGASSLNDWARREAEALAADGIQLYCVTGLGKGELEVRQYSGRGGLTLKSVFSPFCDQMGTLMSAADLVVSRAGAGTLAELIRCATPAILIPYPQAADNHQWANARAFEQQGGGIVIAQEKIGELTREIRDLIFNDWLLRKFSENLQRMDGANSLDELLDDLAEITEPSKPRASPPMRLITA